MTRIVLRFLGVICLLCAAIAVAFIAILPRSPIGHREVAAFAGSGSDTPETAIASVVKVDVVSPNMGGMDRTSVQPGSIHAYEATELFANISGYLHKLHVDIGDRVTVGKLLIEIAAPEYLRDVDRSKASVERAVAQVGQMESRIVAAVAELHAAETGIARATAAVKRDVAAFEFRDKQSRRFRELANVKSIDERLVDEKEDQRLAAQAAVDASNANLAESHALVASAAAKVEQANADLRDAQAQVEVAKADLAKAKVFADYTEIRAPYDGIITSRGFVRGDFIRAAGSGGVSVPLLTVERTDVVRLVVYVPDGDVPFTDPGDNTITEIEALPSHKFVAKISRIAFSEDKKTRTMRTEVDLNNDHGLLRNGMYGRTTLILQSGNPKAFTLPSTALSGPAKDGTGFVYIVRDGIAHKSRVTISVDNGVFVEITEGLTAKDLVIVGNNTSLADGRRVETRLLTIPGGSKK